MDPVHREVARFLREQGVGRAAPVLVAVSGGGDSVALLHALLAVGQRVGVAHVHHGLRGAEADGDLAFVAELARVLGVAFLFAREDAATRDGRSPEARARELRYGALERLRAAGEFAHLATAHQLDDQAETVLLRAARGTGIAGLAGIRPSLDGGRVLRPLLRVRRAELRDYLDTRGLAHREDGSNANLATPRNRVRAEVLPTLESVHPGASVHLAALAELASERNESFEELAQAGDGGLWLDAAKLAELDDGRRRRALHALAARAGLAAHLTRAHVARIDAFLSDAAPGRVLSLPSGFALLRDRARLWLGPASGPSFPSPLRVALPGEGALEFPERGLRLSWHACAAPDRPGPLLRLAATPHPSLLARSPVSSDRIWRGGRERALKDLFAKARWSRQSQARALVVERNGEIVWVPGLVRSERSELEESPVELRAVRLPSPSQSC